MAQTELNEGWTCLGPEALLPCACTGLGPAARPEETNVGTGLSCQLHSRATAAMLRGFLRPHKVPRWVPLHLFVQAFPPIQVPTAFGRARVLCMPFHGSGSLGAPVWSKAIWFGFTRVPGAFKPPCRLQP